MIKSKVALIGYGYVGKGMHKIFPDAILYDIDKGSKDEVNQNAELAIVCVPTPIAEDGSCDASIVEEAVCWLNTPYILIKSTVSPGTTDKFRKKFKKRICFSPEYIGEGKYYVPPWKYPDPADPLSHGFFIVGGDKPDAERILQIFQRRLGPDAIYRITDSTTAELTKYMENAWGATKVIFCNEFYDIAEKLGVSYSELRELWLLDKRVERMHTAVFADSRGFGGKCYPKDVSAIIKTSESVGYEPRLLKTVVEINKDY
ncbi:hypothetical protein A2Z53_01460 [Candidatus Giovannonibacteria bacterium RIFCSPHIGHO2_02_42_15]|uniref:UDP-glucose/GDP-mannose dehydrogenase dimerisation domain-containing protein n=2 Tax=Candidatus Giovannoniibacteriota TaxID=1752738 RepID=A0A1F5VNP8_9BACT|nr:MAG: hypothetical protein A2Z53_01460 [Candidatus Giovannonibacteria bacterium RIFCSPHIGHO2_02_42_15]